MKKLIITVVLEYSIALPNAASAGITNMLYAR